jgi:very-short-patch-repair endonuclease
MPSRRCRMRHGQHRIPDRLRAEPADPQAIRLRVTRGRLSAASASREGAEAHSACRTRGCALCEGSLPRRGRNRAAGSGSPGGASRARPGGALAPERRTHRTARIFNSLNQHPDDKAAWHDSFWLCSLKNLIMMPRIDIASYPPIICAISLWCALIFAHYITSKIRGQDRLKIERKPFLTRAELDLLNILRRVLPRYHIACQVATGALLKPQRGLSAKEFWRTQNKFSQKITDFVVLDPYTGSVEAIIELDDSSHDGAKDRERDAMLALGHYRVIRIPSKPRPSERIVREHLSALGSSQKKRPGFPFDTERWMAVLRSRILPAGWYAPPWGVETPQKAVWCPPVWAPQSLTSWVGEPATYVQAPRC